MRFLLFQCPNCKKLIPSSWCWCGYCGIGITERGSDDNLLGFHEYIDICIHGEIAWLNKIGIKTDSSCCGHGETGYIGTNDILKMRNLGYKQSGESKFAFIPKSKCFCND